MKLFLILPIIYSVNLLAMGDPTFLPANQEMKKSQSKKDKKQMQQEIKTDEMKKDPKQKTKGDL
jgi:hypothetical protein